MVRWSIPVLGSERLTGCDQVGPGDGLLRPLSVSWISVVFMAFSGWLGPFQ
jgi:hypothetical protein